MNPLKTTRRAWGPVAAYLAVFLAAALICPLIGPVRLSLHGVLDGLRGMGGEGARIQAEIFRSQRVPRVALGLLVGGTLACVGAALQVVLRNPLAEPYTVGVTGGASVGAFLAIMTPGLAFAVGPISSVQLFALLGAACALGLIYIIARRPGGIAMSTLLLAGVTISILSAGGVMLIRYLASPNLLVQMDRWMMGGLDVVGYGPINSMLPLLLPGLGLVFLQVRALNHLAVGEELAKGHGVNVARVQAATFVGGGVATAAAVSVAGPIGFVGLIVPHAVRRLSGFDQRVVLPASFLLGGAVLAACDTLARTARAPSEIPVGVITALVGGPLFIYMLVRMSR
jgi:iron complex transport system permease protein